MDWYEGFKKDCPSGKLDVNEFKEIKHLIFVHEGRKFTFSEHHIREASVYSRDLSFDTF